MHWWINQRRAAAGLITTGCQFPSFPAFEGAGMLSLWARFGVLQAPLLLPLLGAKSAFEAFLPIYTAIADLERIRNQQRPANMR